MTKEISRRFSGSTAFESLVQGATARQTMIEANLGAWMRPQASPETPVISDQDSKILNIWHRLPVPVRIALVGIPLSTAIAACGGKAAKGETTNNGSVKIEPVASATRPPEPTATNIPKPTPTLEAPSKEPVPGSCLVLEEKYCKSGELFEYKAPLAVVKYVGFHLPKDVTLFAPFDGSFSPGGSAFGPDVKSAVVLSKSADAPIFSLHGALRIEGSTRNLTKGTTLAFTENKDVGLPNGYNLVIAFYKMESGQQVLDQEKLSTFLSTSK